MSVETYYDNSAPIPSPYEQYQANVASGLSLAQEVTQIEETRERILKTWLDTDTPAAGMLEEILAYSQRQTTTHFQAVHFLAGNIFKLAEPLANQLTEPVANALSRRQKLVGLSNMIGMIGPVDGWVPVNTSQEQLQLADGALAWPRWQSVCNDAYEMNIVKGLPSKPSASNQICKQVNDPNTRTLIAVGLDTFSWQSLVKAVTEHKLGYRSMTSPVIARRLDDLSSPVAAQAGHVAFDSTIHQELTYTLLTNPDSDNVPKLLQGISGEIARTAIVRDLQLAGLDIR